MTTSFVYTRLPNTAQYKRALWDGQVGGTQNLSLVDAKKVAEKDPAVSYFFHSGGSFTLESDSSSRTFRNDDAAFFSGEHLWLGSAPGLADTHLVAEVLDTTDTATRQDVLNRIRADVGIPNGCVDTRGATKAEPRTVTVGFVFCDFQDVRGGAMAPLRQLLVGPQVPHPSVPDSTWSTMQAFVWRESNERVTLAVDTYPTWVTLKKNHAEYTPPGAGFQRDTIIGEVDAAIEFPDTWDVVMFVFPRTDTPVPPATPPTGTATVPLAGTAEADDTTSYRTSATWGATSVCLGGRTVDGGAPRTPQNVNVCFIRPSAYEQTGTTHAIAIHELMHTFGLTDLYYSASNRSFGWTIMSAAGAGTHITGFEKLAIGWDDLDNYAVLKRGLLPADDIVSQNSTTGRKGVLIWPDENAGRADVYFLEKAQEIGQTGDDRATFRGRGSNGDYGLLLMIARRDGADGRFVPYVCARPGQVVPERDRFGGASKAPFTTGRSFSTNGVFSFGTPGYGTDVTGRSVARVVGVAGSYRPPSTATMLRENETIVSGSVTLKLTLSGVVTLDGVPCTDANGAAQDPARLVDTDYGYCLYVDGTGDLVLAGSVSSTPLPDDPVVRRFARPTTAPAAAAGTYYFAIEGTGTSATVAVYRTSGTGTGTKQYVALRHPAAAT